MTTSVLVAEDEPGMAEMLSYRLEKAGYVVTTTDNGADALRCVAIEPGHLVLLDSGLPDIDGLTVLTKIRTQHSTIDLPVVMLSGDDEPATINAALAAGANRYFVKPVEPAELLQCISELTNHADEWKQPFDLSTVSAWLNGDSDKISTYVKRLVENLDDVLATMKQALASNDYGTLGKQAHQLRGSIANVKAEAARAAIKDVERSIETRQPVDLAPTNNAIEELRVALQIWLRKNE